MYCGSTHSWCGHGCSALTRRDNQRCYTNLFTPRKIAHCNIRVLSTWRIEDCDKARIISCSLDIGEVEILPQCRCAQCIGTTINTMPGEVHWTFRDDTNIIQRGDNHRERIAWTSIGMTKIIVHIYRCAALWQHHMRYLRTKPRLQQILHLHLRGLNGVRIF